jgi:hypothetical protein
MRNPGRDERERDQRQGGVAGRNPEDQSKAAEELDAGAEDRKGVARGNPCRCSEAAKPAKPISLPQPLSRKM